MNRKISKEEKQKRLKEKLLNRLELAKKQRKLERLAIAMKQRAVRKKLKAKQTAARKSERDKLWGRKTYRKKKAKELQLDQWYTPEPISLFDQEIAEKIKQVRSL